MSHDKIKAAARQRMAETGEPYSAARRAVLGKHQAAGDQGTAADPAWFPISYRDAGFGGWLDRYHFGRGPGRAGVTVDADLLRIRALGDFRLDVPRASVRSVTRSGFRARGTRGMHEVGRGRWLVNGTDTGLVELVLDPPLYLGRTLGTGLMKRTVNSVIMSLVDPDGFIAAVQARQR
jgi:hypothetical protein